MDEFYGEAEMDPTGTHPIAASKEARDVTINTFILRYNGEVFDFLFQKVLKLITSIKLFFLYIY